MIEENLRDQVALVTGAAGSGIGAAIVDGLAQRGAAILAIDRSANDLDRQVDGWRARGIRCWGVTGDVSDQSEVAHAVGKLSAPAGPPTVVVNSAGVGSLTPLDGLTTEDWAGSSRSTSSVPRT